MYRIRTCLLCLRRVKSNILTVWLPFFAGSNSATAPAESSIELSKLIRIQRNQATKAIPADHSCPIFCNKSQFFFSWIKSRIFVEYRFIKSRVTATLWEMRNPSLAHTYFECRVLLVVTWKGLESWNSELQPRASDCCSVTCHSSGWQQLDVNRQP